MLGVCSLTAITSPSLFKRHNESRAPSLSRHYPASSVILAPPTSRPPDPDFGFPYTEPLRLSPATNEISRVTHHNFPHMPSRRPRRAHLLPSRLFHRWHRPSPLDHRVGTLNQQVTRLYGFPCSTACKFAILSFWKVFSIHLALRVTPQNRIFASGVNR